ncbi:molybdenum cofactor biosynthesis protein B [Deinobacterium chartae]|uniref:Molybdenum cofactor biosynthesis protein B n=1 Tax=Deinobacterium chartae TaxID=521158 RepID=A0A841HWF2_9DEIO|nr:molybdenum cofactor biosynthesis protein B [Deinobacterium chartae]MBB6097246.1 molybdenum cofactor biosynthesis protein B [Deinobacterium chartae]
MSQEPHVAQAPRQVRAALLTVSDTRTLETDLSGRYLEEQLHAAGHIVTERRVIPDETVRIRAALVELMPQAQVVILSGGTGIAGRDVTVPVVESMITKPMPGFGELFRMLSYHEVGAAAMLSRAVGGLAGQTLLFALPGSLNAVQTAWKGLLGPELPHLVYEVFRQTSSLPRREAGTE